MNVFEAIKNRRSVRSFSDRAIPAEVLEKMKLAIRYAPSACNFQPWHFIIVTDAKLRGSLAQAANDQLWMAQAPVTMVACGFADQAYKKMGGYDNSIDIDLAIALDHLSLAAVEEGLGTCWIGAFKEEEVKTILNIPNNVKVVGMMPVGYPATANLIRPIDESRRKADSEIFSTNSFGQ
ncbi:MAG: nitroreductase [Phycisphaerae bacterium]|jgi:nitroreductase|nr:nitroreductase [Phycisphaerae bacterium]